MRCRFSSVFGILVLLTIAQSRKIYSGKDIDLKRLCGVWYLTFGVNNWDWNVLWGCHLMVPFNTTENDMNVYSYEYPKNKLDAHVSIIDDVRRDSLGYYWINSQMNGQWENIKLFNERRRSDIFTKSSPVQDYEIYLCVLSSASDGQKILQCFTRTPSLSGEEISKLTSFATEQGIDAATLTTFGCGDLVPSDYLLG
ncbi:uncharacterized protein LOC120342875 isoform X2 [Styela clava]|uniref:uncharacterized protein LOC120342873 isoform X2 n=1 Tax=Styela clava TaxID=7725 RepID=UPI00193A8515|nr:uncharacterized protein LOC120342873 isoform X2 [Styela clava]